MPDGLGVQFHGSDTPVLLRGRDATELLRHLFPALDGRRTLPELLASIPPHLAKVPVLETLSLLHERGLLRDAAVVEESTLPSVGRDIALHRQSLFWGRNLGITRSARSPEEIQRRLRDARVILVGTGLFGALTFDLLSRSGCEEVRALAWQDDDKIFLHAVTHSPSPARDTVEVLPGSGDDQAYRVLEGWLAGADLLVTAVRNAHDSFLRTLNRRCLWHRRQWLCGNYDGATADIGPYVVPHESACYACMEARRDSASMYAIEERLYQEHLAARSGGRQPTGEAIVFAALPAAFLASEVVRVLTGLAPPACLNAVVTVSVMQGELDRHELLRVPRCTQCYPLPGSSLTQELP